MDEPRYGKRSPNWQPEPADTPPAHKQAGDAQQVSTPWPAIGELSDAARTTSHRAIGNLPGSDRRHDTASRSADQWTSGTMSEAHSAPQMPGSLASPEHSSHERERTQRAALKKRGRRYVIWGMVLAFLLSPIVTMGYLVIAADLMGLAGRMAPVASGNTVNIDASGGYMVMALGSGGFDGCTLSDTSGQEHRMEPIPGSQPSYWIANLTEGPYTIACETSGQTTLMGATGINPPKMNEDATRALLAGTITGFTGITMAIMGARRIGQSRR